MRRPVRFVTFLSFAPGLPLAFQPPAVRRLAKDMISEARILDQMSVFGGTRVRGPNPRPPVGSRICSESGQNRVVKSKSNCASGLNSTLDVLLLNGITLGALLST